MSGDNNYPLIRIGNNYYHLFGFDRIYDYGRQQYVDRALLGLSDKSGKSHWSSDTNGWPIATTVFTPGYYGRDTRSLPLQAQANGNVLVLKNPKVAYGPDLINNASAKAITIDHRNEPVFLVENERETRVDLTQVANPLSNLVTPPPIATSSGLDLDTVIAATDPRIKQVQDTLISMFGDDKNFAEFAGKLPPSAIAQYLGNNNGEEEIQRAAQSIYGDYKAFVNETVFLPATPSGGTADAGTPPTNSPTNGTVYWDLWSGRWRNSKHPNSSFSTREEAETASLFTPTDDGLYADQRTGETYDSLEEAVQKELGKRPAGEGPATPGGGGGSSGGTPEPWPMPLAKGDQITGYRDGKPYTFEGYAKDGSLIVRDSNGILRKAGDIGQFEGDDPNYYANIGEKAYPFNLQNGLLAAGVLFAAVTGITSIIKNGIHNPLDVIQTGLSLVTLFKGPVMETFKSLLGHWAPWAPWVIGAILLLTAFLASKGKKGKPVTPEPSPAGQATEDVVRQIWKAPASVPVIAFLTAGLALAGLSLTTDQPIAMTTVPAISVFGQMSGHFNGPSPNPNNPFVATTPDGNVFLYEPIPPANPNDPLMAKITGFKLDQTNRVVAWNDPANSYKPMLFCNDDGTHCERSPEFDQAIRWQFGLTAAAERGNQSPADQTRTTNLAGTLSHEVQPQGSQ